VLAFFVTIVFALLMKLPETQDIPPRRQAAHPKYESGSVAPERVDYYRHRTRLIRDYQQRRRSQSRGRFLINA